MIDRHTQFEISLQPRRDVQFPESYKFAAKGSRCWFDRSGSKCGNGCFRGQMFEGPERSNSLSDAIISAAHKDYTLRSMVCAEQGWQTVRNGHDWPNRGWRFPAALMSSKKRGSKKLATVPSEDASTASKTPASSTSAELQSPQAAEPLMQQPTAGGDAAVVAAVESAEDPLAKARLRLTIRFPAPLPRLLATLQPLSWAAASQRRLTLAVQLRRLLRVLSRRKRAATPSRASLPTASI